LTTFLLDLARASLGHSFGGLWWSRSVRVSAVLLLDLLSRPGSRNRCETSRV